MGRKGVKNGEGTGKRKFAPSFTGQKLIKVMYIAKLFKRGWSLVTIKEHLCKEWDMTPTAVQGWISKTYQYLREGSELFVTNLRRIQLERLEFMLEKAMEKEDWKTANTIADTINKTFALYEIKTKVEINDATIRFKFDNPQGEEKVDIEEDGDNGEE